MLKRHRSLALHLVMLTAAGSLLGGLTLLAGCGQKGPLTLAAPPVAKPPASSPTPAR